MIGIIDYQMGNLGSVVNACRFIGLDARILTRPSEMDACTGVILPGVGAFGDAMAHLRAPGYDAAVRAWVAADRPLLGICVGMQVLFEASEEAPGVKGLGLVPGVVKKFVPGPAALKVPQMGWNAVHWTAAAGPFVTGVPDGSYFYFVHSYHAAEAPRDVVAGETEYGCRYTSAIRRGRMFAMQFHPEKSQAAGLQLLRNFARVVSGAAAGPAT